MSSFCRASLSAVRCGLFQTQTANRLIRHETTVIRCMSAGTTEKIEVQRPTRIIRQGIFVRQPYKYPEGCSYGSRNNSPDTIVRYLSGTLQAWAPAGFCAGVANP